MDDDTVEKTWAECGGLLSEKILVEWAPKQTLLGLISKRSAESGKYFIIYVHDPLRDHDEWLDLLHGEKEWKLADFKKIV